MLGTDLVPPVVAFGKGYENGAKAINPDIEVISTYHPGEISQAFVDPEWGAATARQALDQGADIIFGAGGQTGNGALQEVAAAVTAGGTLFCIGVDTDQWETLPAAHPCLVSSAVKQITPGVVDLIGKFAADGTMTAGNHFGGAAWPRSMTSRTRSRRKSRTSWPRSRPAWRTAASRPVTTRASDSRELVM